VICKQNDKNIGLYKIGENILSTKGINYIHVRC